MTSGRTRDVARTGADRDIHRLAQSMVSEPMVVDATAIYHSLLAKDDPVALYEDHPCISPPWDEAAISYVNEHGNVIVMHASSFPLRSPWETENVVEWERVRWEVCIFVWIGGRRGDGSAMPTSGPVHMWQLAVYDDGEPADVHWVHLVPEYPMERWDMAQLVVLGALNFVNCRNVVLIDPIRPRAEARRIARTGITVHTINVLPTGSTSRGLKGDPVGVPITSVRGHFACYGERYGRGLLFGKLSGRFWIPQHARGDAAVGESRHDFRLTP